MLYGSRLRGYTPYARGLRSGLTEWIIWRIIHKRKLANCFIYSEQWMNFHIIYYPLCMFIMQVYHDSDRKMRHRSYTRLRSEDATPVVYPTPVGRYDSGRITWLHMHFSIQSTSWPRSYILTPVAHHGFGRWACRLSYHLSYERLRMVGLDDYIILQPRHLVVRSRLGGMHDLISIWNIRSHSFACGSS
jgi:hypothetical protein